LGPQTYLGFLPLGGNTKTNIPVQVASVELCFLPESRHSRKFQIVPDSGLIRLTNYPLSYQPLFWFVRWIRLAFGKMDSIFFNTMYTNLCNPITPYDLSRTRAHPKKIDKPQSIK